MDPEAIGRTRCGQCAGTGKTDDETACPVCEGTGLVPVFRQAPVLDTPPAGPSRRRRFARYYANLPLKLRDQREREFEGRCVVIAEGGLAAVLPEPIAAGSVVTLELLVPTYPTVLEPLAIVRCQIGLRHGFEFLSLTDSEQDGIRMFCSGLRIQSERTTIPNA
jgi:hypothetical protein